MNKVIYTSLSRFRTGKFEITKCFIYFFLNPIHTFYYAWMLQELENLKLQSVSFNCFLIKILFTSFAMRGC